MATGIVGNKFDFAWTFLGRRVDLAICGVDILGLGEKGREIQNHLARSLVGDWTNVGNLSITCLSI